MKEIENNDENVKFNLTEEQKENINVILEDGEEKPTLFEEEIEKPLSDISNVDSSEENKEEQNKTNLGKFKDVESLLKAYNNLQAEFTKKCQKLSSFEKEICDNCTNNEQPQIDSVDWKQKVGNFLSENQLCKDYASEISNYIINNPALATSENALEIAWAKILLDMEKAASLNLNNNDYVFEIANKNNFVKDKIINDYVSSLKKYQSPKLINKSGGYSVKNSSSIDSLEEASKLVKAMFR